MVGARDGLYFLSSTLSTEAMLRSNHVRRFDRARNSDTETDGRHDQDRPLHIAPAGRWSPVLAAELAIRSYRTTSGKAH